MPLQSRKPVSPRRCSWKGIFRLIQPRRGNGMKRQKLGPVGLRDATSPGAAATDPLFTYLQKISVERTRMVLVSPRGNLELRLRPTGAPS